MRVLIGYGTTHGHTARIAERIAARMREHGAAVVVAGSLRKVDPFAFDAVVLGGRVHGNSYPWHLTRFIRRNLDALRSRPSAFFSVSLLQLSDHEEKRLEATTLPGRAIPLLGWTPDRTEIIAGALPWTKFRLMRPLMKAIWVRIMKAAVVDTTHDQVYTDWAQVDRFAETFLHFAELCVEPASAPADAPPAWRAASTGESPSIRIPTDRSAQT